MTTTTAATITKTGSYADFIAANGAEVRAIRSLPLAERFKAENALKTRLQRQWVKAGRPGCNPVTFL